MQIGNRLICIKEFKTLKVGSHYSVKGSGILDCNADPEVNGKKGFGFCIEDEMYGSFSGKKDWWKSPHNEKIKWYYFTEKEIFEYFTTEEEHYKVYLRNEKLKEILG
jgi:hypothetical protein